MMQTDRVDYEYQIPASAEQLDESQLLAFQKEIDQIRKEAESRLGPEDAEHIRHVRRMSRRLELWGRGLIALSPGPVGFGAGVVSLWAHKSLELMEIGHMALHGAYDKLPDTEPFHAKTFYWKAPIDEESWRTGHNVRHHQYTNIEGRDPDLDFRGLRLSARVKPRDAHRRQPWTNLVSWTGFAMAIQLHVTGMLDHYMALPEERPADHADPKVRRRVLRTFASKPLRYYGREYVLYPLLSGPFFARTLLGNVLSEVGRDVFSGATIYCGHVGARDYPPDSRAGSRARWYVMQIEGARNVRVPPWLSVLMGALDRQIEHHLFPRMPPNRLREIAPRVKEVCERYGVRYLEASWPETLRDVLAELRRLSSTDEWVAPAPEEAVA